MKKYKRLQLTVNAEQYFPYLDIDVKGFKNIIEEVLDPSTMDKIQIVRRAEIIGEKKPLEVGPGDWVVEYPDGSVSIRANKDFMADFIEGE